MDITSVRELQSNDRLTIKGLYNRYRPGFLGFGKRYGLGEEDLLDIYQEAFLALRKKALLGKLDTVKCSMKTYLFAIGKFKIIDALGDKKRTVPCDSELRLAEEEIDEIAIEEEAPLTDRQILLRKHLKSLGESCRKLLTLFYYQGLTIKDIVAHHGYRNSNVVKAQKSRCLKTLKEMMLGSDHE